MCGDRFSSSTTCSRWRHETEPGRLDQSLSCRFWKVATHPLEALVALEASAAETRSASAAQVTAVTAELADLRAQLAALEAPAAEARAATTTQLAEVMTELGELRTQVQALDEPTEQARLLAPRVGQVTDGLADLRTQLAAAGTGCAGDGRGGRAGGTPQGASADFMSA